MRPNQNSEISSECTYHKKGADTDMSLYDRLFNSLKKLDTSYSQRSKGCKSQSSRAIIK